MTPEDIKDLFSLLEVPVHTRLAGDHLQVCCPFAKENHKYGYDKDYKMGISPKSDGTQLWHCFSCGIAGRSLESLFLRMELELDIPTRNIRQRLKHHLDLTTIAQLKNLPEWNDLHTRTTTPYAAFPESWLDPFRGRVPKYLLNRGIELETCKTWELGFDREQQRAIFPVRDMEKNLVGAVGRYIGSSTDVLRYNNYWSKIHKKCEKPSNQSGTWCSFCREKIHPVEDVRKGFERRFFLYGEHLFPKGANGVLVEGKVDTLKTWQALQGTDFFPLGSFGSELSPEQVKKAISLTKDKLIMLFDPDDAGKKAAEKLLKKAGRKIKIFSSQYPVYQTEEQPDPGALPPEEIREAVLHARLAF